MTDAKRELREEYRRLIGSMEYAYAMGAARTIGRDPRLEAVLDRVAELERALAADDGTEPPPAPRA